MRIRYQPLVTQVSFVSDLIRKKKEEKFNQSSFPLHAVTSKNISHISRSIRTGVSTLRFSSVTERTKLYIVVDLVDFLGYGQVMLPLTHDGAALNEQTALTLYLFFLS